MNKKLVELQPEDIEDLTVEKGYSVVSNKVAIDGLKIGYMYREEAGEPEDSGWRFLSGTENEAYINNPENSKIFGVNTVANFDRNILPYLSLPPGTELERMDDSSEFRPVQ